MTRVVLVVGTGTDVGKTHVTCALARAARADGARVTAWKPVATGVGDGFGDDARAHAAVATDAPAPLFVFTPPISPHLAARRAGRRIDGGAIVHRARALATELAPDLLLIEGAGGLYTPFDANYTHADLARALAPDAIVLVAPDRLGVLHDVTACLRAARADGLRDLHVALAAPAAPDPSTGANGDELVALGVVREVAAFPRQATTSPDTLAAAKTLLDAVGVRRSV